MPKKTFGRRSVLAGGLAAAGAVAAPAVSRAEPALSWRMVTSWPKNSPGPGKAAQRLADRINRMAAGRLSVTVHAAGELVPALEVFDAVGTGVAEMAHSASLFWRGKVPAAALFTAGPFGLTAQEHHMWVHLGGGQQVWDELYAPFNLKPYMAGNMGMQMGGWFKKEIKSLDDLKGLKQRIAGLGGEILKRLGGTPVVMAPSEIFTALQTGAVDGAEFLGPAADMAFGFYKAAPFYYWPGYHEPNGAAECLINTKALSALPDDLIGIIENACAAENSYALAEMEWANASALQALTTKHGVQLRQWPDDVLAAARKASEDVYDELAAHDALSAKTVASFRAARERSADWGRIGYQSFFAARKG